TEEEFNWRPAAGEWSVEECVAHLTMVGHVELGLIEQAIDRARERGITGGGATSHSARHSAIERYILRETEPPVRHARRSPKRFVPAHNQPVTAVLPTF